VKKILVTMFIGVLCLSMSSVFSPQANAESVPNGIVYSVPITVTNTQSVATNAPYQQMISVDSSKYGGYEAANLQNVEFFDSSGSVIYSWLESGNSNSSTNSIYWLNLPNGIAAKSSSTMYLGFASQTTNLFNGVTIGEAPSLSATYGQYDNGHNIFSFYDNFAGTTLSTLWVDNSAQTENTFTIDNGIIVSPAQAFNNWTSINSVNTFSQGVTEFYGTIPTGDGLATFDGVLVGLICQKGWDSMIGCVAGSYGLITKDGGNWNTAEGLFFGSANIYSLYVPSATSSLRLAEVNYGSTISGNSNPLTLPQPIGFQNQRRSGLTLGPIFWIRERAYPPNGVMPTVLVNGQTSSTSQPNSIFSNPLVMAAIIAALLAGVGVAVYFVVIAKGSREVSVSKGSGITGVAGAEAGESSGTGEGGSGSEGGEGEGSGGSSSEDGSFFQYNPGTGVGQYPPERNNLIDNGSGIMEKSKQLDSPMRFIKKPDAQSRIPSQQTDLQNQSNTTNPSSYDSGSEGGSSQNDSGGTEQSGGSPRRILERRKHSRDRKTCAALRKVKEKGCFI
jgi:hypothetical protein